MKKERIFWGLFFIVAAIFLLVSRLGFLGDIGLWSLLLTVFFVACLVKSIAHKSVSGVLFAVAFLCIVYAKPLGIEAIRNQFLIPSQKGLQELWMLGTRQSLFNGDRRDCGWKPDGV